jgi:uncharacterized protein YyaL (SSP411 family)
MPEETLNSLSRASSSYLRSAMRQPIRWNEWGEEAFAAAQRDNKPILLDIGAVWCHWCHVMDRESYDNSEIAALINEQFVPIKVDRDERPDIDSRYQAAIAAMTGQGGWPLTAFLTPDGKPFFGGTYFPPDDRWGRPGFKTVLAAIAGAYREKHGEVVEQADLVMGAISHQESFAGRSADFSPRLVEHIAQAALAQYDARHGGFGSAPKFPHPGILDLLIDQYVRTGREDYRTTFATTLERMARGGVYDQLAGGFHRYSVDEKWVVPHFEKMSYDNSELLKNYVHAWQATGNDLFARIARDIIRWMDEWLTDREHGGFYASQDADYSMDDDGDYFTWTLDEARAVLSDEELQVAAACFDIGEIGEMQHDPKRNVLFVAASVEEVAVRLGISAGRAQALLDAAREKLYAARRMRPTPGVDKTVYTGWNAMCVSAYLDAARVLGLQDARRTALRALDRILSAGLDPDLGLRHVIAYSDPAAGMRAVAATLEDYAFTAVACLDAYESTADLTYFSFARRIADAMLARFADDTSGGFFDTERGAAGALGALAAPRKPFQDSPTPAGNPMAAIALLRLHAYTGHEPYRAKAGETLEVFAGAVEHFGMFAATWGIAGTHLLHGSTQVVVVGSGARADALYAAAVAPFALNKSVLRLTENEASAPQDLPPSLAGTVPNLPAVREGQPGAVICTGFQCRPPVSDPEELARLLRAERGDPASP